MGIKKKIERYFYKKREKKEIEDLIKIYGKTEKIIFVSTPLHGNLGDQAITIAIKKYLKDKYLDKLVLEIPFEKYNRQKLIYEKLINKKDIIYLVGGGNFGNLYLNEEKQRRDVVTRFSKNKIIIMPQSITFTADEKGKEELEISKNIYSKHKNLTIFTRDKKSYNFAKENFMYNDIILCPDSVLYLEDYFIEKFSNIKRKGVILTLRSDIEKILSNDKIKKIENYLTKEEVEYIKSDTTVPYGVDIQTREYEVEQILKKIASSKINITDRFHGLIFSVITRTPVIVFKSLDHKIEEGIKWFEDLEWVHYVEEKDEIENILKDYLEKEYLEMSYNLNYKEKILNS